MSYGREMKSGYAARRPMRSAQALRQDWVRAIDLAAIVSRDAARAGDELAQTETLALEGAALAGGEVARLMAALRDLKHDNFPVATWSARQMAAGFLTLAQSFVRPEMGPEARTACAPFLAAGALCLDQLLTAERTAAARASWGRQTGERDD